MSESLSELFYKDPYCKTFSATVLSCEPSNKGFRVTLNDTAFYPEGGGQLADHGMIGKSAVLDTRREGGVIYHYCQEAVEVGSNQVCTLDWERRFSNMQNHSGEHIFSGFVHQKFGYENVGFHMDEDVITCDFNGFLTPEDVAELEKKSNEAIIANIPFLESFPSAEELAQMDYRSKIELKGKVRIVDVPGVDRCACCGTHVKASGEVGMLKVLSSSTHRGGTRVVFVCGLRALKDYAKRISETQKVSAQLSVKPFEISAGVEKLKSEIQKRDETIYALNDKYFTLRNESLPQNADLVVLFEENLGIPDLKRFATILADKNTSKTVVILSGVPNAPTATFNYVIHTLSYDLKVLGKSLNKDLNGRGGGNNGFLQGTFKADEAKIKEVLSQNFEN